MLPPAPQFLECCRMLRSCCALLVVLWHTGPSDDIRHINTVISSRYISSEVIPPAPRPSKPATAVEGSECGCPRPTLRAIRMPTQGNKGELLPTDRQVSDLNVGMLLLVKPRSQPARCRPGVLDGNFAEDLLASDAQGRPGFVLDRGGAFDGTSTAQATFTPKGGCCGTSLRSTGCCRASGACIRV